jgi:signal peptidase I
MKTLPVPVKKFYALVSQVFFIVLIILGSTVIFHNVYYTPVKIVGSSMEPTLFNHEFGIMDANQPALNTLSRFDIVVVQQYEDVDRYIIKRIIGMPGETLVFDNQGVLMIDNQTIAQPFLNQASKEDTCYAPSMYGCNQAISIGKDQYFLLGDNRGASLDSRVLGYFNHSQFIGKLIAIEGTCVATEFELLNGSNCPRRSYQIPRFYL